MSEAKKKNLFDDSDGEEEEFKPTAPAEAQPPATEASSEQQPVVEAPVAEAPKTEAKPSLFDDDDDDYKPPVAEQTPVEQPA